MKIKSVGIVGAGTMGSGIAQVFASSGLQVVLNDQSEHFIQKGMDTISNSLDRLVNKEIITSDDKLKTLANIQTDTNLETMAAVDFVVEAVTESLEIKASLFQQLDKICKPETVLATNTSSISITRIAGVTNRPDRVIGMHFMNPVPLMKLVEIIRALQTSNEVYARVNDLSRQIGKVPVECKDSPGFVSNRILMPMINEAIYTLHEGVASAEAIDEIMTLGMAHPMGPLTLADFIGLDICLSILEVLHKELGDSKYHPCPLLRRMVDAGYLGRKTGKGFYEYDSA